MDITKLSKNDIYKVYINSNMLSSTILYMIFNSIINTAYIESDYIKYFDRYYQNKDMFSNFNNLCDTLKNKDIKAIIVNKPNIINNTYFNGIILNNIDYKNIKDIMLHNSLVIINSDNISYNEIIKYNKTKLISYGINSGMYKAININNDSNYMSFDLSYKDNIIYHFKTKLFNKDNIYEILSSICYSYEIGIPLKIISGVIENINDITYRFDNKIAIISNIDMLNDIRFLLKNINQIKKNRIILVIGSKGEINQNDRSKIGYIASIYSDILIFTSLDPKCENIFNIFDDLTKDIINKNYYLTISRYDGINMAYSLALDNDIIIILGKGNENCEYILNYKFYHNDLDTLKKIIKKLKD